MPSYKRSRYAAVNERRRKQEWNRRSTGQLGRRRRERATDLQAAWTPERRGQRTRHGLVNTGYMASLMADRAAILAEARGEVAVGPSHDGRNQAYVRAPPTVAPRSDAERRAESHELVTQAEDGTWVAHLPDGTTRSFRYKLDAESAARTLV